MPTPRVTYKYMYEQCAQQITDQQQLITILQQQLMYQVSERETSEILIRDLDNKILQQYQLLDNNKYQIILQQDIITTQSDQLQQYDRIIRQQDHTIRQQQQQIEKQEKDRAKLDRISHELRLLKKWVYGIKSERRIHADTAIMEPGEAVQGRLALEIDEWGICHITDRKVIAVHIRTTTETTPKIRGGRHQLPKGLEEEVTILDVENIPAGARLLRYEEQRQLACNPLRWYIKTTRRPVYLVDSADGLYTKQYVAPLPAHPIPRCKVDVSVLVMLLTDKYLYHLPVWRQRSRFIQYGIELSYSTLSYFINRACDVLEPLWELLLREIIKSRHLHLDESTYKVLDDTKKKGKRNPIWAGCYPLCSA